jgi:hypothetical protein
VADYQETYSLLLDDQILKLATETDSLTEEARAALAAELTRRGLTATDVEQYVLDIRQKELESHRRKILEVTIYGFGTSLYGKRDFHADGSYLTTRWVVFVWLPIVPVKSYRLRILDPSDPLAHRHWWSRSYLIEEVRPVNLKQAIFVYGFFLGFLPFFIIPSGPEGSIHDYAWTFLMIAWCAMPWLLRQVAKRRTARDTAFRA